MIISWVANQFVVAYLHVGSFPWIFLSSFSGIIHLIEKTLSLEKYKPWTMGPNGFIGRTLLALQGLFSFRNLYFVVKLLVTMHPKNVKRQCKLLSKELWICFANEHIPINTWGLIIHGLYFWATTFFQSGIFNLWTSINFKSHAAVLVPIKSHSTRHSEFGLLKWLILQTIETRNHILFFFVFCS